jgi:hypothetical protein
MADNRIDGSAPREKLYESMDDDPAKIAEDKAKLEYAAKQTTTRASCENDPSQLPCAPKDRTASGVTHTEIGKNMPKTVVSDPPKPNAGVGVPNTTDAMRKAAQKDGVVSISGHDGLSVYEGGTDYKKTFANGTAKVEFGDHSVQLGMSSEIQLTSIRATTTGSAGTGVIEGPAAKFSGGVGKNDDGSTGYHAGASATVVTAQVSHEFDDGGSSVTGGVSVGVGAGVSVGGKTATDGSPVVCAQVSALFFTVGACVKM